MRLAKPQAARPGFTLIEMLVVILIILMLAGMMVMVSPGVSTRQQAARGATQLQSALLYAKNRAKMNMLPTGIVVTQGGSFVQYGTSGTGVQYIQAGGDWAVGLASGNGSQVMLTAPAAGIVNPGDSFEIAGSGLPHLITGVGGNNLTLASPLNNPFTAPVSYRVMRSPRALYGEAEVHLPQDVGIDLSNSAAFVGSNQVACPTSVLFSPSGALTGPTTGYDIICFYVRDITEPSPLMGFPTIVAVYGKTGFITAHPVNVGPGGPFFFAQNARSSGM